MSEVVRRFVTGRASNMRAMLARSPSVWGDISSGTRLEHATFYCRLRDATLLDTLEFYSEDLRLLREIADEVTVCTKFRSLIRAKPGLLWVWWHASALPAIVFWRLMRRPVVATGAVDLSNSVESSVRHRLKRRLTYLAARLSHVNVSISEYERLDLTQLSKKLTVRTLYPGVDCSYFRPTDVSDTPLATVVAQVNGPSIQRKGLDRLIEAFVDVRRRIPGARLVVIGPIKPDGTRWIESFKPSDLEGVEFVGYVERDRKRDLVSSSWVYVQPSRYEGFGLAVAEATACGVKPIVTSVGSLPEVVGSVGVISGGSAASLADSICDALASRPTTETQVAIAHEALRFASATRTDRFRRLIGELVGKIASDATS